MTRIGTESMDDEDPFEFHISNQVDYDYELVNDPKIKELLDEYKATGYTIEGIQKETEDGITTGLIKCLGVCKKRNKAFVGVNGSGNTISTYYVKRHITSCHKPNSNEEAHNEFEVPVMNKVKISGGSTSGRTLKRPAQSRKIGASGDETKYFDYELVYDTQITELLVELKETGFTIEAIMREMDDETWTGRIKCVGYCKVYNKPFKALGYTHGTIRKHIVRKHIMTKHMPPGFQPPSPKVDYDYELVNHPEIKEMLDEYKESGYTIEALQKQIENGIWTGLIKCVGLCKQNNKPIIALSKKLGGVKGYGNYIPTYFVKRHITSCHKPNENGSSSSSAKVEKTEIGGSDGLVHWDGSITEGMSLKPDENLAHCSDMRKCDPPERPPKTEPECELLMDDESQSEESTNTTRTEIFDTIQHINSIPEGNPHSTSYDEVGNSLRGTKRAITRVRVLEKAEN